MFRKTLRKVFRTYVRSPQPYDYGLCCKVRWYIGVGASSSRVVHLARRPLLCSYLYGERPWSRARAATLIHEKRRLGRCIVYLPQKQFSFVFCTRCHCHCKLKRMLQHEYEWVAHAGCTVATYSQPPPRQQACGTSWRRVWVCCPLLLCWDAASPCTCAALWFVRTPLIDWWIHMFMPDARWQTFPRGSAISAIWHPTACLSQQPPSQPGQPIIPT